MRDQKLNQIVTKKTTQIYENTHGKSQSPLLRKKGQKTPSQIGKSNEKGIVNMAIINQVINGPIEPQKNPEARFAQQQAAKSKLLMRKEKY